MPVAYLNCGDANGHERPLRGLASSPKLPFILASMDARGEVGTRLTPSVKTIGITTVWSERGRDLHPVLLRHTSRAFFKSAVIWPPNLTPANFASSVSECPCRDSAESA